MAQRTNRGSNVDHGMVQRLAIRIVVGCTLLATLCLLSGCLAHYYTYKFNLIGDCDFHYSAKGDSVDLYSPPGSYPEPPFYRISTYVETDSSGKEYFVLEASGRFAPDSLPRTLSLKEVLWTDVFLQHPATLKRSNWFFWCSYTFNASFKGRRLNQTEGDRWKFIPEECRILESGGDSVLSAEEKRILQEKYAAGLLLWNVNRYKLRFREIIQTALAQHPERRVPQAWVDSALAETYALVDAHVRSLDYIELDFASLEWWQQIAPEVNRILAENLNLLGDSTLHADLLHVAEILELRHQVNQDLDDESFEVRVDLPGRVIKSNAKAMDTGVLIWQFAGAEIGEKDFDLQARSLYLFPNRVIVAAVLIVLPLLILKFKRKRSPVDRSGPPPPR